MPSRKVRRRREKLKRHEYEWVMETDEGEEVPLERPAEAAKRDGKARAATGPRDRRGREVPKPSMGRVLRRTAIFAPLILVFVWVTSAEEPTGTKISTVVILLAFFIPFSYLVDVFMYRILQRRQERAKTGRS
jgi:hypothetical protein